MSTLQLPLAFRRDGWHRLSHLEAVAGMSEAKVAVLGLLQTSNRDWPSSSETGLFFSGPPGSGKSHLLMAACAALPPAQSIYLPLQQLGESVAPALMQFSVPDLVCVDELDAAQSSVEWQIALFHLFNRVIDAKAKLIVASSEPLPRLNFELPDLVSRLGSLTTIALQMPTESERREIVRVYAKWRGIWLDENVLDYLFRHSDRHLKALMAVVDRLDRESLAAQRKITVPFLKSVMSIQD